MPRGIDYGMGTTNVDTATGIRYGVIPANDVPYIWDSVESDYGDPSCPKCGGPVTKSRSKDYRCKPCRKSLWSHEVYGDDPIGHDLNTDGIAGRIDSHGDLMIFKSPYYTRAAFCSPCAPGACYLTDATDDGERAYCLPHDWFDGPAPYPVYRADTGEIVPPPVK